VEPVERVDAARAAERTAAEELAECAANVHLYSRTGVRAQLLNGALAGIETIADGWLARLAATGRPLHLVLKSYTEKASGGVTEAISLEVVGAGNGLGYKAASGGERQRINAALCFALGEVAAAAYGVAPGTLILDELFESLDTQGAAAVCDVLTDLAQDRAVLLITHRDDLVAQLKPAVIWRVASGAVTVEIP
jgi:DNA repair exonuclease SbcCD ATPase subunit